MLTIMMLIAANCYGQDFKKEFIELTAKNDTTGEAAVLTKWEKKSPDDPELFIAYFNYYIQKSLMEVIEKQNPTSKESKVKVTDSSKKVTGTLAGIQKRDTYFKKGMEYIDQGIAMYPNRLDMRFGKIYVLGLKEKYHEFTDEIVKTIEYSGNNNNVWVRTDNNPEKDTKKFMLNSVQGYVAQLYQTKDEVVLDDMKRIAETVIKYYPDHVESLSDLSIVYFIRKEYDKGIEQLLKALKITPDDYIVLNNIAQAYKAKGDKENAIKYYELLMKYGDDQAKISARQEINGLKNK